MYKKWPGQARQCSPIRPVVVHGHKRATVKAIGCGFDSNSEINYLMIACPRSGIEARREAKKYII